MAKALLILLFPAIGYAQSSWTDRWSFKGDLRFRNEQTVDTTSGGVTHERNRQRIRARLGVNAKVNPNTDVMFRLATGDQSIGGTTSTNQDLTNYGANKMFNLDLAYANWKSKENAQVWVGKTPVVFYQPGTSDMLFDSDLTPEGVFYKEQSKGDGLGTFWNLGYWMMNERHSSSLPENQPDVMLVGGDLGLTTKLGDMSLTVGAGYLNFANIRDSSAGTTTASTAKGNTVTTSGTDLTYTYKYEVTRGFAELTLSGSNISLYVDYAQNSDAEKDNVAQLFGIKWGQLKEVGSWMAAIDYREVQKDSTVGIIADADSAGGGTDIRSARYNIQYQAAQGFCLGLVHFDGKRNISSTSINYQKTFVDLSSTF